MVVIRKAKEGAGLTSMSAAEWAKTVDDAVGTDKKMTVAVVMLGTQDRQPLKQEGDAAEPLSDTWRDAYRGGSMPS